MEYSFNPLRCYSADEVASLMNARVEVVRSWNATGLLRGIKTGKSTVYPFEEVKRFQENLLTQDIATPEKATQVAKKLGLLT